MSTPALITLVIGGGVIFALLVILVVVLRQGDSTPAALCGGCNRLMKPEWARCLFCGWAPNQAAARLEFMCGPLGGQVFPLSEEVTTIGSVQGNTIVLADTAVSRKHVGIRRVGPSYEFADLGSTNGVYCNGHRMPRKDLIPGDIIRVGNTEIMFRTD